MPSIGAVWWTAEIRQAEEAADKADRLQSELDQTAESARRSNKAMNRAGNSTQRTGKQMGRTRKEAGRFGGTLGLLTSALFFLISTLTSAAGVSLTLGGAWATITAAASGLWGWLVTIGRYLAGGLVRGFSLIAGYISSFVSWLAAGSAGALAVAAAIGAVIGLLVVFVLEMTGVLDVVQNFGKWMGDILPGWVVDGIIILVMSVVGWLAVLGAAIVGFVRGFLRGGLSEGIDQAVDSAMQALDILFGAWDRTLARVGDLIDGFIEDSKKFFNDFMDWLGGLGSGAAASFENVFNSMIPASLDIPSITIGGGSIAGRDIPSLTIGGGALDLPQLQTGGLVENAGAAFLHPGEAVVPADVTRDVQQGGGGGGGGGGMTIENVTVEIGDQTLDLSTLSRTELKELASLMGDEFGAEIESLVT